MLPAVSGSGKSTLTAALCRAGFGYLTDELLVLNGVVAHMSPERSALRLRVDVLHLFPELEPLRDPSQLFTEFDPIRMFGCPSVDGIAVTKIVFPKFESGTPAAFHPLSKAEALVEMCKNTMQFNELGAPALEALADVVREVPCTRLRFGELDSAVALLAGFLEQGAAQ